MRGIQLLVEMTADIYSVAELNRRAKMCLEQGMGLVSVQGEISNLTKPSSGHWYLTLKDQQAQIRCVFFRHKQLRHHANLTNGMQVIVQGSLSLYEARGDYQLIAETMNEAGLGDLHQQFEQLKQRLFAQGLFDAARKKPLPRFPKKIGVITSPTGAAIRDILTTLKRRYPLAAVQIYPSDVQGKLAAPQLRAAIELANQEGACDVLILARGGGSIEDLWAFNDEALAHAIVNSRIPIVTGVGHEIDVTIADLVADLRAPTPTAAAEIVTPLQEDLLSWIAALEARMLQALRRMLQQQILRYHYQQKRLISPKHMIATYWQTLDHREYQLRQFITHMLQTKRQSLQNLSGRLQAMSPLATLERGYAVVTSEQKLIRSVQQIAIGEKINIRLADGQLDCKVLNK
ncbi:MAG: exodeoxyribonuclease VII large subunit [Gammaproteobacteria bacterium]